MNITLYRNASEDNVIAKSLSSAISTTGTAREPISMEDTVVTIEGSGNGTGNGIDASNYAYIPQFGRYYFIRKKTWITNDLCELQLHVDVLMSFKSQIGSMMGVGVRENQNNGMILPDECTKISQRGYAYTTVNWDVLPTNPNVVLITSGNGSIV